MRRALSAAGVLLLTLSGALTLASTAAYATEPVDDIASAYPLPDCGGPCPGAPTAVYDETPDWSQENENSDDLIWLTSNDIDNVLASDPVQSGRTPLKIVAYGDLTSWSDGFPTEPIADQSSFSIDLSAPELYQGHLLYPVHYPSVTSFEHQAYIHFTYVLQDMEGDQSYGEALIKVVDTSGEVAAIDDFYYNISPTSDTVLDVMANDAGWITGGQIFSVTQPQYGSVTINGDPQSYFATATSVTYHPDGLHYGTFTFTYTTGHIVIQSVPGPGVSIMSTPLDPGPTATVTIQVDPPLLLEPDLVNTPFETPVTFNVLDNDSPSGLTLTDITGFRQSDFSFSSDGTVTYTPPAGFVGQVNMTYSAKSSADASGEAGLSVVVAAPDEPVANLDELTVDFNTEGTSDVLANDSSFDGSPLVLLSVSDPTHGTVEIVDNKALYTPDEDYVGPDSFTYAAGDRVEGVANGQVNVTVNPPADPSSLPDTLVVEFNTPGTSDVLANDSSFDDSPLVLTDVSDPEHGTVEIVDNKAVYTPDEDYVGSDSFTYTATDRVGSTSSSTVSVTVKNPEAPSAAPDSLRVGFETPGTVDVLANDTSFDLSPLTLTEVGDPEHGTVEIVDNEALYTPDKGYAGADSFTYTATDRLGAVASSSVSVTVLEAALTTDPTPSTPPLAQTGAESAQLGALSVVLVGLGALFLLAGAVPSRYRARHAK